MWLYFSKEAKIAVLLLGVGAGVGYAGVNCEELLAGGVLSSAGLFPGAIIIATLAVAAALL